VTGAQVADSLPPLLAETLPHLKVDRSVAVVCKGASCLPPVSLPEQLLNCCPLIDIYVKFWLDFGEN
jgi:hypothetical protein